MEIRERDIVGSFQVKAGGWNSLLLRWLRERSEEMVKVGAMFTEKYDCNTSA